MVQKLMKMHPLSQAAMVALITVFLAAVQSEVSLAATAPALGVAESFAILGSSTVTNTGLSQITGDLGVSPGAAVTGFPPGIMAKGAIHTADARAAQGQVDATAAYENLADQSCDYHLTGQDLGGMTLLPAVYCFASSAQLTGTLAFDAAGDSNAVWVIKTGSTLTTAGNSSVQVINGGQNNNVFWQIGSSATLGTATELKGNIIALTSITFVTGTILSGRALALNGAVTMDTNTIALSPLPGPSTLTVIKSVNKTAAQAGQGLVYLVKILNPNLFSINSVAAMDSMSPYTAFMLNSFQLSDGTPVSGLTMSSGAISYSNNNGSTWSYMPVSGQGGQPAGYDGTVTNWKVIMNPSEAMNGNSAYFLIQYSVLAR
jgi:uncharacterized repeat protein (TIGR01451 family)